MVYDKTDDYESRKDKVKAMLREQAPSGSAIGGSTLNNIREQSVPQSLCDTVKEAVQDHDGALSIYWEAVHQMRHAREAFEAADYRLRELLTEYMGRDVPNKVSSS